MTEPNRGDRVGGRFVLVRRLGSGAHGETWLADDLESPERVALKLPVAGATDALAREADAMRRFAPEHPGVARVHGIVALGDGRIALAQEHLPGGDLVGLRGRPWHESLPLLRPVLDALAAAHDAGLAHGDLKPANVVRDADGRAKLVDFGVAALVAQPGRPSGSPYTRSPAQWRGEALTPQDDAYGLGALLFELVAGHPPFYPHVTQARVEHEAVPALHAPHPVPPALESLVHRLLAKSPAERPDVRTVQRELESLLATAVASTDDAPARAANDGDASLAAAPPGVAARVALAPPPKPSGAVGAAWQPAPASSASAGRGDARSPARSRVPLVVGSVLALAAIAVVFVLPRWVAEHPLEVGAGDARTRAATTPGASAAAGASGVPATPAAAAGPKPLPTDPAALAELAKAKTGAEEARTKYEQAVKPLVAARAEVWGGADWTRVDGSGKDAERAYRDRDYVAAATAWAVGAELAARVQQARAPALKAALAAGRDGLAQGDSRAARVAYERALAIEPAQKEATAGLARAQNLDRVLALVDEGSNLEKAGQLAGAAEKYREALALDAQTPAATAGLARIASQNRSNAFATAMAQGQKALAAGNRTAARAAFERARALDPGAAEVSDAFAQLDVGDRTAKLAQLRADAEAAERAERWADAVKSYDAALALDPTVLYAQEGRARAVPRAQLAARIDAYLTTPGGLNSAEDRGAARRLLRTAAAVQGAAPQLRAQAERLDAAIVAAETPVRVALASDNLTEVLVYRVGRLGSFERRELELLPGRYTIVGRRAGFRDVRREVDVPPGGAPAPVEIRCTDPI
ncbi:serine/threonine protein kinase [Nostoc favosum]|uniref:non-specific serine/threonine protein kinase n=1 Tax=Nostoc favosum CHAB5714 TaxID=2780399 RepID=A0ABS8ILW6_9NOSO|nr:serine/threonine protein kinase [Nostoc favosum]MCC5604806.1 protein kinase [Nostoc favosum CHAB5714]